MGIDLSPPLAYHPARIDSVNHRVPGRDPRWEKLP